MRKYREEFEKIPEIYEILISGYYYFHEASNEYNSDVEGVVTDSLDLSWTLYQKQQKRIDELQARLDNLSVLICGDVIDILSCVEGHGDNSQLIKELEQAFKGEEND